ncbi:hypothetical protein AFLA_011170 [Aspergillus flavus NRRL3357]|nr:hypothetical protein AFLA_011170 [Aspergillus flavus NRRL3357]
MKKVDRKPTRTTQWPADRAPPDYYGVPRTMLPSQPVRLSSSVTQRARAVRPAQVHSTGGYPFGALCLLSDRKPYHFL